MRLCSVITLTSSAIGCAVDNNIHIGTYRVIRYSYVNPAFVHHIVPLIRLCYNLDYVELGGSIKRRQ